MVKEGPSELYIQNMLMTLSIGTATVPHSCAKLGSIELIPLNSVCLFSHHTHPCTSFCSISHWLASLKVTSPCTLANLSYHISNNAGGLYFCCISHAPVSFSQINSVTILSYSTFQAASAAQLGLCKVHWSSGQLIIGTKRCPEMINPYTISPCYTSINVALGED